MSKFQFFSWSIFEYVVPLKIKYPTNLYEPVDCFFVTRGTKNKLIKTHTARRSGCTNMYLRGIAPIDVMKISGHKTEREFLKYIKVTKEETAKNLINHPFFSSATLSIAN